MPLFPVRVICHTIWFTQGDPRGYPKTKNVTALDGVSVYRQIPIFQEIGLSKHKPVNAGKTAAKIRDAEESYSSIGEKQMNTMNRANFQGCIDGC